ncbi:uncharacterized protein LOC130957157 [Arachis stenosperma]|uniref:uncharacterized protein LOC130957157 n=1 Tax=Arachis stenosperma TaxID=217475 RepID=UPI0025ACE3B1|nr:uncharacterized protein LOC130957157 [Arachis stenosperma]
MGQAFRRASGRIRASSEADIPKPKKVVDPPPPRKVDVSKATAQPQDTLNADGGSKVNLENVLEERDPKYDAMLGQMLGRITAKPGGKPEMGEAFVVEKSKRPMPKLRDTKPDSGRYEERPVPAGNLNVAQLRHIFLLHEGRDEDHRGPMDVHKIAEKFRIEAVQIQRIFQFLSLPPENSNQEKNKSSR